MTISAKVIEHTKWPGFPGLFTLQLRYPRFIHAEFMTHRVFSRNASSSRAVPVERIINEVFEDTALPTSWGKNKPGMQADGEHDALINLAEGRMVATEAWRVASMSAIRFATAFSKAGYHKQVVNRILEPFAHISVVVTATEWDNFFKLRLHPDADPTMYALAEEMRRVMEKSEPVVRQYHLPYISDHRDEYFDTPELIRKVKMISAARCARVSYLNHDGSKPDEDKDLALANRLLESNHMSPFEHQATANPKPLKSNLVGWTQFRKELE